MLEDSIECTFKPDISKSTAGFLNRKRSPDVYDKFKLVKGYEETI